MSNLVTTLDGILNRRLLIEQPAEGFRIAIDTVLLAAAVRAKPQQKILELGCGVGGAMLALAYRVPDVTIQGLEIQPELAALCEKNIQRNALAAKLNVTVGDVLAMPMAWHGQFDHVMMNPPYHDLARHDVSTDFSRRTANAESEAGLLPWFKTARSALVEDGNLTLIHRADRLVELVTMAQQFFPRISITKILPKSDAPAKRVIMHCSMGQGDVTEATPLILHEADGRYTAAADKILRDGLALA